jgi:hypothetical protein
VIKKGTYGIEPIMKYLFTIKKNIIEKLSKASAHKRETFPNPRAIETECDA